MGDIDQTLVERIRQLGRAGASVSEMANEASRNCQDPEIEPMYILLHLQNAFFLTLGEAKPVVGWWPKGEGELNSDDLDRLVLPHILRNRPKWDV